MENKPRMISGTQLVFLLLISRLFTLFTFVPRARTAASGSTALLCIPLAGAAGSTVMGTFPVWPSGAVTVIIVVPGVFVLTVQ